MITSFKVQDFNIPNDVQELFCQIDKKMAKLSKQKLDSARYDLSTCISNNTNYKVVITLSRYRDILTGKVNHSECLAKYSLTDIINKIKKILNTN